MGKTIIALVLCVLLTVGALTGCAQREKDETLRIVCTIFPLYEWTRGIVGDAEGVEVILLIDNGTDSHSYQPTTEDIVHVMSADLVLYVGSQNESWVERTLSRREDGAYTAMDMRYAEGVTLRNISAESIVATDDGHSHGHGHGHEHGHTHGSTDEHLWLSLRNAVACGEAITRTLCALDEEAAEDYRARWGEYSRKLLELDQAYAETLTSAQSPTMLFADRFPFVYLAEDYGIRYVAAFEGCTTEADASPATILHLAEHADEWGLRYIFVTESSDGELASSVRRATRRKDQEIVVLDSMQNLTASRIEAGETYLGIMERNLKTLQTVFSSD